MSITDEMIARLQSQGADQRFLGRLRIWNLRHYFILTWSVWLGLFALVGWAWFS